MEKEPQMFSFKQISKRGIHSSDVRFSTREEVVRHAQRVFEGQAVELPAVANGFKVNGVLIQIVQL